MSRHPVEETYFGHYPKLTAIGEGANVDQLFTTTVRTTPALLLTCTNPPADLSLHLTLTGEQDLDILELLHEGQQQRVFSIILFLF